MYHYSRTELLHRCIIIADVHNTRAMHTTDETERRDGAFVAWTAADVIRLLEMMTDDEYKDIQGRLES